MGEVAISNGGKQLTSTTTANSAGKMQLKPGRRLQLWRKLQK
jgi:hypothetical protein